MAWFGSKMEETIDATNALPGRPTPIETPGRHLVLGTELAGPYPAGFEVAVFGMGCFWGAERKLWSVPGVHTTAVGYSAGFTPNPTYEEVCSGQTGHAEVVRVVFDPALCRYEQLLQLFWEGHDPTQGMRQGNDVGSQYRSLIEVTTPAQGVAAEGSREAYAEALQRAGFTRTITTEIAAAGPFYFAEAYHQQYLARNPNGYCGLGGTGVSCPVGLGGSEG